MILFVLSLIPPTIYIIQPMSLFSDLWDMVPRHKPKTALPSTISNQNSIVLLANVSNTNARALYSLFGVHNLCYICFTGFWIPVIGRLSTGGYHNISFITPVDPGEGTHHSCHLLLCVSYWK